MLAVELTVVKSRYHGT